MVIVLGLMGGLLLPSFAALPSGGRDVGLLLLGLAIAGIGCFSFSFSVSSTIAVFVFSATVRRIFPAADVGADLTAVIPFLVAVPLAARGLRQTKPVSLVLLLGWISVVAALSLGQPAQAIAGWLNLAVPLLAATAIVTTPGGLELLCGSTVVCGAIAATYGIAQYFSPFSWDIAWLNQSTFAKFGTPLFRPFGTLPAPRTAALLSGVVILILIFRPALVKVPRAVKVWALVANTVFILPAQVRNIWVSVAFAALVGAFISRARVTRRLIVPGAVVALIIVASPMGAVVASRAASLTDLGGDASYQSRLGLVRQAGTLASPIGHGLGSLSSGSRGDVNAVENGYVVMLGETGLVGTALLLWLLASTARNLKPPEAPFFAFLILTNMGGFLFSGFGGLLLWSLCGLGRAPPSPETTEMEMVDADHSV
jgi:hypothetical protein